MAKTIEQLEPKLVLQHCLKVGLDLQTVSSCLGIHAKTLRRWKEEASQATGATARMLEKLDIICQIAMRLLKANTRRQWFETPNTTLGGERPVDLLRRGEIDQVRNVLGMLEWGIYS